MKQWLMVGVAVACLCSDAQAQHLGARLQWQPETMQADPRLDQPVEIEIIGRAAVPAMQILSEKTGVSLSVAPEDLNTVGERKLTIISKGLTLKAIMAQVPEALQEAHWDIDTTGDEPVYLLHRNGSAEQTMKWLTERDAARQAEKQRAERVNRMDEAKRALQMSSEELAELEKTDPLLSRSVRDPHSRDLLEILLSLPLEQAEQFRDTGKVYIPYPEASERLQQAVLRIGKMWRPEYAGNVEPGDDTPEEIRHWRDYLSHDLVKFEDQRIEHGFGVRLTLAIPTSQGYMQEDYMNHGISDVALEPRYCSLDDGESRFTRLLMATGVPDKGTAFQVAAGRDGEGFRADAAKREERHQREWIEPTDPDLLRVIVIGDREFADFADAQSFIAAQTGLSVVSDFFTMRGPYVANEYRQGIPLWLLLYRMGEDDFRNGDVYLWQRVERAIIFHRADWPALAKVEIPEWLIADCRARLQEHNEFTLDDLAELAVVLDSRKLPTDAFPRDLQRAGISSLRQDARWAILLYASLSAEQREAISTPDGLPFSDMTIAQRQQVIARAAQRQVPLKREQAYQATFRLVDAIQEAHGTRFSITKFELRFPDTTDEAMVSFKRLPEETPAKADAAGG
jgi:hypothetical protein